LDRVSKRCEAVAYLADETAAAGPCEYESMTHEGARARGLVPRRAGARPEHLNAQFVAGYDRKQGYPSVDADLAIPRDAGVLTPHATLIDMATGTGRFALAAAPHCRRVIAVDVSAAMLEHVRTAAAESGAPETSSPCRPDSSATTTAAVPRTRSSAATHCTKCQTSGRGVALPRPAGPTPPHGTPPPSRSPHQARRLPRSDTGQHYAGKSGEEQHAPDASPPPVRGRHGAVLIDSPRGRHPLRRRASRAIPGGRRLH
jgi:hypothetical protein